MIQERDKQARLMNVTIDPMAMSALESARGEGGGARQLPPGRHFPMDGYVSSALPKVRRVPVTGGADPLVNEMLTSTLLLRHFLGVKRVGGLPLEGRESECAAVDGSMHV